MIFVGGFELLQVDVTCHFVVDYLYSEHLNPILINLLLFVGLSDRTLDFVK